MTTRSELPGMIGTLIVVFGTMYAAFCLYLFLMQSRMIFYPTSRLVASPADIGLEFEPVSLITSDNVQLNGWFMPAGNNDKALLFFHGNAGNISHRLDSLKIFHDLGLSTLIIDYRGYGQSRGSISEQGFYRDAEAAWDYLTQFKKIPPQKIIVFGRSLGGAVAAYIAARKTVAGLILESTFTSVPEMGARMYPYIPVKFLSRYNFDTKKNLSAVTSPVLIIHSPYDDIIPFENGQQLYEAAQNPKELLKIRGDHNEGFLVSGRTYTEGIDMFVQKSVF